MDTPTRALAARVALGDAWAAKGGRDLRQRRGDLTLVIDAEPGEIFDRRGGRAGVDFRVRLLHRELGEIPVDGHRRFVRPPLYVDDGPPDSALGIEHLFPELWKRKRRLDPVAAIWEALWASVLDTPAQENWGDPRGTVTTVFAETTDGYVSSTDNTYSNARNDTGNSKTANTTADLRIGQSRPKNYLCEQGFLEFDTSAIDDGDTVSAIELALWLTTDSSTTDFVTEARERDWGGSVTTADFVAGTSLAGLTLLASIDSNGIGSAGAYKAFTSEAAFLTATNLKTGMVRMLLASSRQRGGNTPTGNEFCIWESANTTGTSNDPKLTITHASSAEEYSDDAAVSAEAEAEASGAAARAGSGAVEAEATAAGSGTSERAGAGAGEAEASVSVTGAAAREGSGAVEAEAAAEASGTAARAGAGDAEAIATPAASGIGAHTGAGDAEASGTPAGQGSSARAGSGAVEGIGTAAASGVAAREGTGGMGATAAPSASGAGEHTGTGSAAAEASVAVTGLAHRAGAGAAEAIATPEASGDGVSPGLGAIEAIATAAASGTSARAGGGEFEADAEATAAGAAAHGDDAGIGAIASVTASGIAHRRGVAEAEAVADVEVAATAHRQGAALAVVTVLLLGTGISERAGAGTTEATATLAAVGRTVGPPPALIRMRAAALMASTRTGVMESAPVARSGGIARAESAPLVRREVDQQ